MSRLRIALSVTSVTPLSVGAGGSAGTLADKTIVRDGWGRPIIPGSQVKGKARWAVERILRGLGFAVASPFDERARAELPSPVRTLFGAPEQPGSLRFADLQGVIGDNPAAQPGASAEQLGGTIRPSVALSRRRGTAEEARLLFQEAALAGTRFASERAVVGMVPDAGHAALLWAGLALTARWGAAASRGLGWATVKIAVFLDDAALDEAQLQAALREELTTMEGR